MAGNDYTTQWANGDNIQTLWNKIKAGFVGGLWDQTGYTAAWKTQARANLDLAFSTFHDSFWAGKAKADEKGNNLLTTYAHSMAFNTINGATYLTLYDNSYNGSTPAAVSLSNIAVNQSSGLLRLDGSGKIPLAHIPDSIAGQLLYAGTVSSNGVCALTDNAKTKWGIQSLTITASNYSSYQGAYFIASADFDSTRNAYIYYDQSYSGDKTVLVGDWVVATSLGWVKVDNTDAVRTISGVRDSYISPAPGTKGDVVMTAQRVGALDLYLPNTTQNVQGKVAFEKDIWSLGGVGAYGISDLSMGGGGGGLSGSILRDWANFNPNDETQILGSNLGIEAFQMSGAKMQFKRNGGWVDAFTLGQGNIPNLELTQINSTEELQKIQTLSATGTPSGFLKRASNGTWSFDTNSYALASALNNYLPLSGGIISSTGSSPLEIRHTGSSPVEIGIRFSFGNVSKGWVGYNAQDGVQLYNFNRQKSLTYKDNGQLLFEGNTVWHAGNDGAGSGLDADLLDGQDGSYYATASSVDTLYGYFTDDSANSAVKLLNTRTIWGQNFDGTANITGAMSSVTNINSLLYFGTGKIGIGVSSPTKALDISGDIQATGNIQSTAGGVAAAGIADLSMGGGTGGSGTVTALKINTHTPISPDADTGVITLNVLEGDNNGTIKVDGENISVHGLGNLAFLSDYGLSDLTGATEVNKIETLASTGTPSGFLKRAAGGAWSFDTTSYLPLAGGAMSNTNLVTNLNADLLDGKHNEELTALNMTQQVKNDQEFTYRVCPKTIDVDSVKLDRIKGKTLTWNQLIPNGNFSNNTLTPWYARRGTATISNGIVTATRSTSGEYGLWQELYGIANHRYYISFRYKSETDASLLLGFYNYAALAKATTFTDYSTIRQPSGNPAQFELVKTSGDIGDTFQLDTTRGVVLIDLTLMFGETVANAMTVEKFEALYLPKYYSYNEGELISNSAKAIECVGFNLWDEEWEAGGINHSTGQDTSVANVIRSKNYIPCKPNDIIYVKSTSYIHYYDVNKIYLSYVADAQGEYVVPSNAYYIRFNTVSTYGSAYNNDICINISKTEGTPKNGDYVPYKRVVTELDLDDIHVKSPNIWDEEWKLGFINSNGQDAPATTTFRSKNFIPINGNDSYYMKQNYGYVYIFQYDVNKNYIRMTSRSGSGPITIGSDASYIKFYFEPNGSTTLTYNNDININKSDTAFNGRYFPHGVITFNGLKSAGSVYDEISSDGRRLIRRIGDVDLGTLSWQYYNESGHDMMSVVLSGSKSASNNSNANIVSAKYLTVPSTNIYAHSSQGIGLNTDLQLRVYSSDMGTNATTFQTAMSGVMLNYELANYETYDLVDPIPTSLPSGTTERRLPEDTQDSVIAPFCADMTYGTNNGDILASAIPWERIGGRPTIDKGHGADGSWFTVNIGGQTLYIRFNTKGASATNGPGFELEISDSPDPNEQTEDYTKSFAFGTLSTDDINTICV